MQEMNAVQKMEMPDITAPAAIVVTQHEGKILLEKNAKMKMYPAFITKILASIIALEKCSPAEVVTVSDSVVAEMAKWKSSASIGLVAGEKLTVLDLVYSMMLSSANDSMFALAEYIAGDKDSFSVMMEKKAASIGAADTIVTDDNNKFTAEQFSNAYDMAIICRYCMTNKLFRKIAATSEYTIPATEKSEARTLTNTNLLINTKNRRYMYKTAIGIKSGYTVRSKACLACSALPPQDMYGEEILVIVLGVENTKQMKYVFYDAVTLFDFTFQNFEALSGKVEKKQISRSDDAIFTLSEMCDALSVLQRNAGDMNILSLCSGKQKIKKGCAYFTDDIEEAKKAYDDGAAVIVSDKPVPSIPSIVVENLEEAKERIVSYIKTRLGLWSIAILDSPDKINPIQMISKTLSDRMNIVKSTSVDNNVASMIKAFLSAEKGTNAAVVNVSVAEEGNVKRISRIASFDVAVIISAVASNNPRDLTKQELIDEKLAICNGMSEAAAVIVNIDDKSLAGIFTIPQDIITIGVDNRMADYFADDISIGNGKISLTIVHGDRKYPVEFYSDDKHSVYQALATFALCDIIGIPIKDAISSIEKFRKTSGLSVVKNERNVTVISDFESTGKESVGAALKELCSLFLDESARRIAVFTELNDGNDYEKNLFEKVGALINKCAVDICVCYGKTASHIANTADNKHKFIVKFDTAEALTEFLKLNIADNDAILFKGSADSDLSEIMTAVT